MAKPSGYVLKRQLAQEMERRAANNFMLQQAKDMMLIAANEAFGFGPDRLKRLSDAFDSVATIYAELALEDAKDDRNMWYTKAKTDETLKRICGEHFRPWEERYK